MISVNLMYFINYQNDNSQQEKLMFVASNFDIKVDDLNWMLQTDFKIEYWFFF